MRRSLILGCMLSVGLVASWPLVGCHDDDEEIRDQPDPVYYEQQPDQGQNYRQDDRTYDDRREYHGERRGWSVDVYRYGDDDDDDDDDDRRRDWDDDDDDDQNRRYYRRDRDDDWDDDDDDD